MQTKGVKKVVVFVPETHAKRVRGTIGEAGAGLLGNYTHCSFSTKGVGRFIPNEKASPAVGSAGELQEVKEEKIEALVPNEKLESVVSAIKKSHPYEEAPIEIYSVDVT